MNKRLRNVLLCGNIICLLLILSFRKFTMESIELEPGKADTDYTERADSKVEMIFTYAENQSDTYPTTQGAHKFAELVGEKTDGRIEIVIKYQGALGDEKSVVEQISFGGVDFARVSVAALSDSIPKLRIFMMPYLYEDKEHQWKVLNGEIGQEALRNIEKTKANLIGLSWYESGDRHFYSVKRPIESLDDLKGMRIRVQKSQVMEAVVNALGAIPVPMDYEEVYQGLQLGDVDAAENNWPSYEGAKHYKVAKYITEDGHSMVPEVQIISKSAWNKLSEDDRKIIKECAEESAKFEKQLWKQREKSSKERLTRAGVQVKELSTKELDKFKKALEPIYEKFCGDYMDIIEEIKKLGN